MEKVVSERRKAFAAVHTKDEDHQAYISASRRALPVITKAKAEVWQKTCSSLLPTSNPKSVYSLLCSVSGSSFSSSSFLNFPSCSSPTESASLYADYLRSYFSVSQPKALRSTATGYLSKLRRATCPQECHLSFRSPLSPAEFLAAASNLSSSTATGPDKVAYSMLKHLPRSGMDFLLHIFNLSWTLHFFPSIWKTSSIIPIHKMEKPLDSPACFRTISLTSCVLKLFEHIIRSRLLFFLESNSILSPRQAGFRLGRSTLDQILYLSQSISNGFNKPRPGSRTILSTIDFSNAFDSVWHPALFHELFLLGKAALAYLPTALSVAPRPLFPSQQAQYAQVFLLKPTLLCKLFVGFGSTNKSAASLLFLSDSRSVLTTLSFSPSFFLSQTHGKRSGFVLLGHNGSLDTRFSLETTRLIS